MRSLLRSQPLWRQWRHLTTRSLSRGVHVEEFVRTGAASTQQSQDMTEQSRSAMSWGYAAAGAFIAGVAGSHVAHAEAEIKTHVTIPDPYSQPTKLKGIPREIIVYQYEVCPFCCKLKAFLDYHKIAYRTVEVSPLTKKQIRWADYKKVPVVVMDGDAYGDSTAIITRLAGELEAEQQGVSKAMQSRMSRGIWPFSSSKSSGDVQTGPANDTDEEQWRRWVDERLVRLLTVNIYRTAGESWQTFKYITDSSCNFGFFEAEAARVVGASMMWGISGRLRKKYDINGDVREELYKAADSWVDAVGSQTFHGGEKPDLADLSVFGVIRSVTCTDTFMDLMHNTRISGWYEQMMKEVGDSARLSAS